MRMVFRTIGGRNMSDKKFLAYISTLPSCVSGRFSQYLESGEGRCIACHVRRASNSGTGYKPEFSAVPLTDEEHKYQHSAGELSVILRYGQGRTGILDCSVEGAKDWFNRKAELYRQMWERRNAKS